MELRTKANSEVTWIKATGSGFRNPKAAIPTPILSTISVPTKILRNNAATASRNPQSLPIKMTSALSRSTSVSDPVAMPTLASTLDRCIVRQHCFQVRGLYN
jgi:hypothetical protein